MKLVCFIRRKPGMTPQQFQEYYEQIHVPLVLRVLPFMSGYRRSYLKERIGPPSHVEQSGVPADFDVVTELTFASQTDFQDMIQASATPENARLLREDEERFIDRMFVSMFLVDDHSTDPARLKA